MNGLTVLLALALLAIGGYMAWGRLKAPSRSSRGAVAAAPEPAVPRVRDLIEQVGNLEADVKLLKREWGDFEKSWERRWGTLARQGRKDAAKDEAAAIAAASADPAQMDFPMNGSAEPAASGPRRLVPTRLLRQG